MTQRPLFDPRKMAVANAGPAARGVPASVTAEAPLSVSQLAGRIDAALKAGCPQTLRVAGEVSGFRERTHWYFDLKDEGAVVNCVMFANVSRKAGFTAQNGQQVVLQGRVDFYAKAGKVTFIVERMEPVGAGALELALRRLKEELRVLGYFSPERKRPLPTFPRRIAVVTSRSAAALQDVLVTMRRRCPVVGVVLVDVRVQGEGAAGEVARAVERVGREASALGVDAILVTRGGGSMEDLWAFNERVVADAIFRCPIPVVAAIGHETDTTIAELVADERCATPTQAAMRLTPDREALLAQIASLSRRLGGVVDRRVAHEGERLRSAERFALFSNPRQFVGVARGRLDGMASLLDRSAAGALKDARHRLAQDLARLRASSPASVHARTVERLRQAAARLARAGSAALSARVDALAARERHLQGVGPLNVLQRGYSVTLRGDGKALRSAREAVAGEAIRTLLGDGSIRSIVEGGPAGPPPGPAAGHRAAPRARKKDRPEAGPGLFGLDAGPSNG